MKKTLAILLAVIMCVSVLAACGRNDPAPERSLPPPPEPAVSEPAPVVDTGPMGFYTVVSMMSEGEEVLELFNDMGSSTDD